MPRGYGFGDKTFYNAGHIGIDLGDRDWYKEPIYAPTRGIASHVVGQEGGQTVHFIDEHGKLWRFLHLHAFSDQYGDLLEGTLLGWMGNSGLVAPKPTPQDPLAGTHTHIDISKSSVLNLSSIDNFYNPDEYINKHIMQNLDNRIIRNQASGAFAYVKGGKKQEFDNTNGSLALTTFLDRLPDNTFPQSYILTVSQEKWNELPSTTVLFPPKK